MEGADHRDETLRLQFGTAAHAIGTQLYAIEKLNDGNRGLHRADGKPRLLAFEAKGRIQRQVSMTSAVHRAHGGNQAQADAWSGGVQVYDQAPSISTTGQSHWSWDDFGDKNLVEIDEFRPYMPLHNVYEGGSTARDGSIVVQTLDRIEDRLRGVLEECDNLRLVQNIVDMDSAWAGLSLEVLMYITEECPGAVVATFGNDWAYPLADQAEFNVYSATGETRDKAKIAARRRINLISSVASFVDASSVFIPVALESHSRRYRCSSQPADDLRGAAAFAATAIEIAISAFRAPTASVFNLLEGLIPSMKVLELSTRFPLVDNPLLLIAEGSGHSMREFSQWNAGSLLPQWCSQQPRGSRSVVNSRTTDVVPPRGRRIHFRGEFAAFAPALQSAIDGFQPSGCVAQWTQDQVHVEDPNGSISAVDAASMLALSQNVGEFLANMAVKGTNQSDHRVLYEFTQAGMNVDALEDFQASLRGWSDAYPCHHRVEADDDDHSNDE